MNTGGWPGLPVTLIPPPMACTMPSKPGRSRYGPSCPKADSEQAMMDGLIAFNDS